MNKKGLLITATTIAAVAVIAAASVTLALETQDSTSGGSLTTADLKLTARATNVRAYSAVPASATDEDVFEDQNGVRYKYQQGTQQGDSSLISFASHDGGVNFDEKSIVVDGILPGDLVEFDISVTSTSTISFNYRAELYVDADEGETLLNQLDFSAGSLGLSRQDVATTPANNGLVNAVLTDYTQWSTFSGSQESIENIHVSISLPIDATEGQGETVKFFYVATGIQNAEEQPDVAEVDGQRFKMLTDAVSYAEENNVSEIKVLDSTVLEEGTIVISDALRFTGVAKEDGTLPTVRGARIFIKDAAGVLFENIRFGGRSYIDVSDATELILRGCTADINPVRFFDASARGYLSDAAFIVAGSSLTPVRITVENCKLVSPSAAAICLNTRLGDGSAFTDNVFGAAASPYGGNAVTAFSGAESGATVRMSGNTFYGGLPISLGTGAVGGDFRFLSENNEAYGVKGNLFVGGVANALFLDYGSKIDGERIAVTAIAAEGLLLGGVDVTLNDMSRVTAGKFVLSDRTTVNHFYVNYVASESLARNAVVLYRDGNAYAYLNSDGGAGFTVDEI